MFSYDVSLEIPEEVGAILLPNSTLFPHGALPLQIFEDRYRSMLTDALEGDCLFCVGNLISEEAPGDLAGCVAPVGTIGLIRSSRELPDGRSHLVLHGILRVHFVKWLEAWPYPKAHIAPLVSERLPDDERPLYLARLQKTLSLVLENFEPAVRSKLQALIDKASDLEIIVDIVAQQFVHDDEIRQLLLEETELKGRITTICDYLRSELPGAN